MKSSVTLQRETVAVLTSSSGPRKRPADRSISLKVSKLVAYGTLSKIKMLR